MAKLEIFKWCTQSQGSGGEMTTEDNIREISFGNGYTQVASGGLNAHRRSFTIVYAGRDYKDVLRFMRAHVLKPFAWTTPEGDLGLFRVKAGSISARPISSTVQEINATFTEQFTSM